MAISKIKVGNETHDLHSPHNLTLNGNQDVLGIYNGSADVNVDITLENIQAFFPEGEVALASGFTNQLPIAQSASSTAVYNGIGYKLGTRWSASGGGEKAESGYAITGFIPCTTGQTFSIKNIDTNCQYPYILKFNSSKTLVGSADSESLPKSYSGIYTHTISTSGVSYIRLVAKTFDSTSIIAVNEEITETGIIKTGWLKEGDEKISPSVLASSIINENGESYKEEINLALLEKAPINHASNLTDYGIGTNTKYGHVQLSDSVSSTSSTNAGIAATPKAVKDAYDKANDAYYMANNSFYYRTIGFNNGSLAYAAAPENPGVDYVAATTKEDTLEIIAGNGLVSFDVQDGPDGTDKVTVTIHADYEGAANDALDEAKSYTDTKVAGLVNSAPETLDTLNELAAALGDDPNFATTVANQIGQKANTSDLTAHTGNKNNPHGVTLSQLGVNATATELNYVDGVTSGIQNQLNAKVPTTRKINNKALSADITLSASDVGADSAGTAQTKADAALLSANNHTDEKFTTLVGDIPVAAQIETAIDGLVSYSTPQELTKAQKFQVKTNLDLASKNWVYFESCDLAVADNSFAYGDSYASYAFDINAAMNHPSAANSSKGALEMIYVYIDYFCSAASDSARLTMFKFLIAELKNLNSASIVSTCFYASFYDDHEDIYTIALVGLNDSNIRFSISGKKKVEGNYNPTTEQLTISSMQCADVTNTTLNKQYYPADAKAVGDALALKADQTALDAVSALVGDTSVSDQITTLENNLTSQIETAINAIPQADWNQNDETAPGYIKNRPFYEAEEKTLILPETTLDMFDNEDGTYQSQDDLPYSFEEDAIYKVIFNGIEYECTARRIKDPLGGTMNNVHYTIIGNGTVMWEEPAQETECPFACVDYKEYGVGTSIVIYANEENVTISIFKIEGAIIQPIDIKYLPSSIPIEKGGTGATTAAGAIAGLSNNKLTLNEDNTLNGVFNSLVINGIDFTLTSAEYDELLSLAGGI